MAGWPDGWLVGNCDFNENPVVHLDLDFDLGFVKMYKNVMFENFLIKMYCLMYVLLLRTSIHRH